MSRRLREKMRELEEGSEIVETSMGSIEYAIVGEGPEVLAIHGGPGGYDQTIKCFDMLVEAGFSLICPSRPGYLRTPISVGRTYEEQARAMAALLDAIGVDRVFVVGTSAGGPPSYEFARLFPERTRGLVAIDALCMRYDIPESVGKVQEKLYLSDTGMAFELWLTRHAPKMAIKGIIATEGDLDKKEVKERVSTVMKDKRKVQFMLDLFESMYPYGVRKDGVDNDMEQGGKLERLPLDQIRVPSFIIHGTCDADVEFSHAEYAVQSIPGAEHIWIEKGTHFAFWLSEDAYDVHERTVDFMLQHLDRGP